MAALPNLNEAHAQPWEVVASEWAGQVKVATGVTLLWTEFLCRPLIFRAKFSSWQETESSTDSQSLTQHTTWNPARQFWVFYRATKGRVRPSVRWRTSRRKQKQEVVSTRLCVWKEHLHSMPPELAGLALIKDNTSSDVFHSLFAYAEILEKAPSWVFKAFSKRKRAKLHEEARRNIKRSHNREWEQADKRYFDYNALDYQKFEKALHDSVETLICGGMPTFDDLSLIAYTKIPSGALIPIFQYFLHPDWNEIPRERLRALFRFLVELTASVSLKDIQRLKALRADAYRAHLTRRVRPTPRRHRIRQPYHARPRPPAAPLAPPVI